MNIVFEQSFTNDGNNVKITENIVAPSGEFDAMVSSSNGIPKIDTIRSSLKQ